MGFKKHIKKAYTMATSDKAKMKYKKAGENMAKFGRGAERYFKNANEGLDQIVGTHDPTPKKLAGVRVYKKKKNFGRI